jgi:hypothetical protein
MIPAQLKQRNRVGKAGVITVEVLMVIPLDGDTGERFHKQLTKTTIQNH